MASASMAPHVREPLPFYEHLPEFMGMDSRGSSSTAIRLRPSDHAPATPANDNISGQTDGHATHRAAQKGSHKTKHSGRSTWEQPLLKFWTGSCE
ncbi:hypothetical protein FH972_022963 [Carpinus fangiana]|uniref:Uncharacterized protein n=1 Tax=Carpinus fangiana TaxID=176857 RepID=A0A5N6KUF0_9ROSI|nr:hypothetical protein FH972_022963 [Carpinus fangiana]